MPKVTVKDPGLVLKSFLEEYQLTPSKIAAAVNLSQSAIRQIILNKMKISVPVALRFAKFFGNPVEFWVGIQLKYDLSNSTKDAKFSAVLKGIQKAKKPAPGKKLAVKTAATKAATAKAAKGKTAAKTGAVKKPRKSAVAGKAKRPGRKPKSIK